MSSQPLIRLSNCPKKLCEKINDAIDYMLRSKDYIIFPNFSYDIKVIVYDENEVKLVQEVTYTYGYRNHVSQKKSGYFYNWFEITFNLPNSDYYPLIKH